MQKVTTLETVIKRDRALVVVGIAGIAAMAWAYMLYLSPNAGMAMSQVRPWGGVDFSLMFIMWAVRMTAMMLPTAAPMILTFATVNRRRREQERPFVPTSIFLLGYLTIWFGFAAIITLVQWGFHQATVMTSMMGSATPFVGGLVLVTAGAFQWTPLKYACLKNCRTPFGFIMSEWRDGRGGAMVMGIRHGAFCVGCCWFLMALMFVAGIMNIIWMAGIAAYMLVEKVTPPGKLGNLLSWSTGVGLVAWGAWMILGILNLY